MSSYSPPVSVIIPNYNGRAYLQDCLDSLSHQTWPDFETILLDNGSSDGSAEWIKQSFPHLKLIELSENLGFAGGCNYAAAHAGGEWLVFLNNDTIADPHWLKNLMTAVTADPKSGAGTSKILLVNDHARLDSIGSYLTATGFLSHIGLLEADHGQYDTIEKIFSPKGVAFAIRKDLFQKLDGFDHQYFAYFEETDLFWRVWLAGYQIIFAPKSVIYHKVGGTALSFHFSFVDYHSFKNRIRTILKNAQGTTLLWMLPFHLACCAGLVLANMLRRERWPNAWAIVRAFGWNIRHLPETWKARRAIQKSRRISDHELFKSALHPIPVRNFFQYMHWMIFSREKLRASIHSKPNEAPHAVGHL